MCRAGLREGSLGREATSLIAKRRQRGVERVEAEAAAAAAAVAGVMEEEGGVDSRALALEGSVGRAAGRPCSPVPSLKVCKV